MTKKKLTWQEAKEGLKNWRHWNWRRICLSFAIYAPLLLMWALSIQLGITFLMMGWVEVTELAPRMVNQVPAHEILLILNGGALLMGVSLIMMQVGLFTLLYIYPQADAFIDKVTPKKETTR